jgi:hypothetical protein
MPTNEPVADDQRGDFWTPAAPETRITGLVRFGPPLAGQLVLDGEIMPGAGPEPLIHGALFNGQLVTAIGCYASGRTRRLLRDRSHVTQTLSASTLLVGEHIGEDQTFDHVIVRLTYLREWANVRVGWGDPDGEASRYSISYEGPPARTATLTDRCSLTLRTIDDLTTSRSAIHSEQQTQFMVAFPAPVKLQSVMDTVASLRDLVTFAARRSASVISLTAFCPGVVLAPGTDIQRPLELHSPLAGQAPRADTEKITLLDTDFLFLCPESSEDFARLAQAWMELEARLGLVLDLFLSLYHAPPLYLDNQMMNICQVAESYHRATQDYRLMTGGEYGALTEQLLAACPEPRHKWLTGILLHSNSPSFKVRIEELVTKAGAVGTTLASTFTNYPGKVRDSRNQYAHWLPGKSADETRVIELAALYDVTKIILEACLLQDLGWSQADAASQIAGKRDFERLSKRPRL